ncbi:DUF2784 domain-containing protein [Ornithinimicrobium sp. Y1847]|uniref:DUF2784 domain-containing protein n=1 Tax=unclassified Ornithinimicrobium TaxID=2615080 RepID=UPI003B67571A
MGYRILADVAMVTHLLFLVYVVIGGYLAWRWRWTIWLHLIAASWGFSTIIFGVTCPLTYVENWARESAGQQGLPAEGFIDHYLTGVVYPQDALWPVRIAAALAVLISWVGYLLRRS